MEQEIPFELRAPTKKALQWLNRENNSDYDLTGLVGADKVSDLSKPFEIGLILCDGELCARKQVAFTPTNKGFIFSQIELEAPSIPPHLDPPPGIRKEWINNELSNHEFILLIFYRGLW